MRLRRPAEPMTLEERADADDAYKQAKMEYDDDLTSADVRVAGPQIRPHTTTPPPGTLRPAELRTLALAAEGLTMQESADLLGLSYQTVRYQLKIGRTRLRARNTAHAVMLAIRTGQLSL